MTPGRDAAQHPGTSDRASRRPQRVSVVVPVRDGEDVLGAQLAALARQRIDVPWELVVADSGSRDGTRALLEQWRDELPALRVVDASGRPGAAHARNVAADVAAGDLLAFCDADDVVADGWLAALVEAAADADLVGGLIDAERLNDELQRVWRPPPPRDRLPVSHGFLPYAYSANLAVRADVFHALGGFRTDYPVGEDVELTWRAQLASRRLAFAPDAVVHYRYRPDLRGTLRQYLRYGTIGPRLYRDFADRGMPPSPPRAALGPWVRLLLGVVPAWPSPARRGDVLRRLAFRAGRVRGSLAARVVYL